MKTKYLFSVFTLGLVLTQSVQADLVSRWRFNDPTETALVSDVQGGGNDLTVLGSPTYVNTPGAFGGYQNRGLHINDTVGDIDGLKKAYPGGTWNLDLTSGFSLVAWVQINSAYRTDGPGNAEPRIMGRTGSGYSWTVYTGFNEECGYHSDGVNGGTLCGGLPIFGMSGITQLAYTWDGTTNPNSLKLYKSGVLVASATTTTATIPTSVPGIEFLVGFDPPYRLNAVLDELQVWNTALSASQLSALSPEIAPEPGALLLLVFGGALLFWRRKR